MPVGPIDWRQIGTGLTLASDGTARTTPTPVATTYGATTTVNVDGTQFSTVSATGDLTLAISGTPGEGQVLVVAIFASGGVRNVTLPSGTFNIPTSSGATSPVAVASGTETVFAFRYSARTSKWRVVSIVGGYS